MPQMILYLDDKENEKIEKMAAKYEMSKADTIKKIIAEA